MYFSGTVGKMKNEEKSRAQSQLEVDNTNHNKSYQARELAANASGGFLL